MNGTVSFSIFEPNAFGHGGQKRSFQIQHLLGGHQHRQLLLEFKHHRTVSRTDRLRSVFNSSAVVESSGLAFSSVRPNTLLIRSYDMSTQKRFLKEHDDTIRSASAVIWENNLPDFFSLPFLIRKEYSKPIIACPHNLESLVPGQSLRWLGRTKAQFLNEEIRVLQRCDGVFTISEEEQWLLNLFDVPAKYLPYYPAGVVFEELKTIRSFREATEHEDFFLIVGSVSNTPTREGMQKLLKQLTSWADSSSLPNIVVTGYGTGQLAGQFSRDNVTILGYTDRDRLAGLMMRCRAVVINQGYSTGALTKIPEMLVAGIPVLADDASARSFRRMEGVHIFNSYKELFELMSTEHPMPSLPPRPTGHFNEFLSTVTAGEKIFDNV